MTKRTALLFAMLLLTGSGCVDTQIQPSAQPEDPNDPNPRIVRKVQVGLNPIGVRVVSAGDEAYAYVVNSGDDSLSKVRLADWRVVSTIQVAKNPAWLALGIKGEKLYVTAREGRALNILDVRGNYLLNTIDLPYVPERVVLHPQFPLAFVGSGRSPHVMVVDLDRKKVVHNMVLNGGCAGLDITPDGSTIFVSTQAERYNLQVISTKDHGVVFRTDVGSSPQAVVVDDKGEYAYVANHGSDDLTVVHIPTQHPVINIPVGQGPVDVVLSKSGKYAYVACQFENAVAVVDLAKNQVATKIDLEVVPYGMDLTPDGQYLLVANYKKKSQGKGTQGLSGPQISLGSGAGDRIDNSHLLVIDMRSYR